MMYKNYQTEADSLKIGEQLVKSLNCFPVNPELLVELVYKSPQPSSALWSHRPLLHFNRIAFRAVSSFPEPRLLSIRTWNWVT